MEEHEKLKKTAVASRGPVATQARVSCTDCDQLTHSSGFSTFEEAMLFLVFAKEISVLFVSLEMSGLARTISMSGRGVNIRNEKNEYKDAIALLLKQKESIPHGSASWFQ